MNKRHQWKVITLSPIFFFVQLNMEIIYRRLAKCIKWERICICYAFIRNCYCCNRTIGISSMKHRIFAVIKLKWIFDAQSQFKLRSERWMDIALRMHTPRGLVALIFIIIGNHRMWLLLTYIFDCVPAHSGYHCVESIQYTLTQYVCQCSQKCPYKQ